IVKIGEKLVEMKPEWVDTVRRLLPAYPGTGRPLDLFEREFPEVWHERFPDTPAGSYDLVALINWGVNKDLTTNPYTMKADAARTYSITLADLGLDPSAEYLAFEFWDQKYLGAFKGTMEIEVPPHRAYVIALRKKEPHPQFIGTNRHLLTGAVGVNAISWNDKENVLSIKQEATPGTSFAPFEHRITFSVPAGWEVKNYAVSGLDKSAVTVSKGSGFGAIAFSAKEKGEVELKVYFARGE
ncbi:MAG: hypothetical protein HY897_18295, partial [Deltaproteobacteria bacterium]|nr:hypothetical protein [Deltaproteobacteria bacterium]